jgi:tape measure domain-containing protein
VAGDFEIVGVIRIDDRGRMVVEGLEERLRRLGRVAEREAAPRFLNLGQIINVAFGVTVAHAIMGLAQRVSGLAMSAIAAAGTMQQMEMSLVGLIAKEMVSAGAFKTASEAMTAAQASAKDLMEELAKIAILSPYQLAVVQNTFRMQMAFGATSREAVDLTRAILNMGAALGADAEMLGRLAYNFAQIRLQGKVTAMDVRQLAMAGMDLMDVLRFVGEKFKIPINSIQDFNKAIASGRITWKDFTEAFAEYADKNFGGAANRMARTLFGLQSTMADIFTLTLPKVIGPAVDTITGYLSDLLDQFLRLREDPALEIWGYRIDVAVRSIITSLISMRDAFSQIFNDILSIVLTVGESILMAFGLIDPTARHSPSLVERVRAGTAEISSAFDEMSDRVQSAASAAGRASEAIKAQIRALEGELRVLERAIKAQERVIRALRKEIQRHRDIIRAAQEEIDRILRRPLRGEKAFIERFNQLNDQAAALKVRIMEMTRAGAPPEQIMAMIQQLQALESQAEAVDIERRLRFDPLHEQLERLAKATDEFEISFEEARDAILANKATIEEHSKILASLEAQLEVEQEKLEAMRDAASDLRDAIADLRDAIRGLGKEAPKAVAGVAKAFHPKSWGAPEVLRDKLTLDPIAERMMRLGDAAKEVVEFIRDFIRGFREGIGDLREFAKSLGTAVRFVVDFISKIAGGEDQNRSFAESLGNVAGKVTALYLAFALLKTLLSPVFFVIGLIGRLGPVFQILSTIVTGVVIPAFSFLIGIIGTVAGAIGTAVGAIASALGLPVAVVAAVIVAIVALVAAIIAYATNFLGFRDTVNAAVASIRDWVVARLKEISAWFSATWASITSFVVGKLNEISTAITTFLNNAWLWFYTTFTNIYRTVVTTILNIITEIRLFFSTAAANVMGWAQGLLNEFVNVGRSIIDSISSGIWEKFDALKNSVLGAIEGLLNTIRGKLKMHSPSGVMMEIGKRMAEGLHIGFQEGLLTGARGVLQIRVPEIAPAWAAAPAPPEMPSGDIIVTVNIHAPLDDPTLARRIGDEIARQVAMRRLFGR